MGRADKQVIRFLFNRFRYTWLLCPLIFLPLQDSRSVDARFIYEHAFRLFTSGYLEKSQQEAESGIERFQSSDQSWAAKFRLLQAESMLYRGMYRDALNVLTSYPVSGASDGAVEKLSIEAVALTRQKQLGEANWRLAQARQICGGANFVSCGNMLTAHAISTLSTGDTRLAREYFTQAFSFARSHDDPWRQANAALNLGFMDLQIERYDEALDWFKIAYQSATRYGYENIEQGAAGNIGWAYYQLGDGERALEQFVYAEKVAARLGVVGYELNWILTAGYVYRDTGDLEGAARSYRRALDLARQIDSREDIANALQDLALVAVERGKLAEAQAMIDQVLPMETINGTKPEAELVLIQGKLAAARHDYPAAIAYYRALQENPENIASMKIAAGVDLAAALEIQGRMAEAERVYKAALAQYESARAALKNEESQLPFGANASDIYRSYAHFLVKHGKSAQALALADQSRARTLSEGLGEYANGKVEKVNPEQIARKTGATLLFYWLDAKESYLWAITPTKTAIFTLPGESEIAAHIQGFNRAIQEMRDPLETPNPDGTFLYEKLVAPARGAVDTSRPVIVLADGALSPLNFETLPVPAAEAFAKPHYLIEDWTMLSAASLDLLAHGESAKSANSADARKLLLVGNPVAEDKEFPALPYFGAEMKRVAGHFGTGAVAEIAGARATPAAYTTANPANYDYIHFVSHATASRTNPLDSAIILSAPPSTSSGVGAYKLYAREILEHPLNARLVTVSACNGSGTRAYAGEGLVGLSWAFLRAGARQVIAALWEASDDSTPRIMDSLYAGIEAGKNPAAALREAKLTLLHTKGKFRKPYYWGPFQIYSRE